MSNYLVTGEELTGIADAIRAKTGESSPLEFPTEFVSEIGGLPVLDTSDGDAMAADLLNGKIAYANGQRLVGSLVPLDTSDADAAADDIFSGKTAYVNGQKITGSYDLKDDLYSTTESYTSEHTVNSLNIPSHQETTVVTNLQIPSGAIIRKKRGTLSISVASSEFPSGVSVDLAYYTIDSITKRLSVRSNVYNGNDNALVVSGKIIITVEYIINEF